MADIERIHLERNAERSEKRWKSHAFPFPVTFQVSCNSMDHERMRQPDEISGESSVPAMWSRIHRNVQEPVLLQRAQASGLLID